ncbi:MAG TPA: CDP-diacylglycerol--glycerol-3-phosphate 3-phosphatidyltransferase [Firmicutes bacterium]|nr:CDP-diacylglycerol--glycerol-3-phosphate 3-phosphatidyltransferase [Bacillota bacterium]
MNLNTPNKLTIARVILSPVVLLLLLWDFPFHHLAAMAVFGAAALTDLFDGRIARSRGLITNLGKFLDPIADKMLTTAAFLGFLVLGRLDVWAVMLVLTREFMVATIRMLAAKDDVVVAADFAGKAKTVAQFVAILFMFTALEFASWQDTLLSGLELPGLVFSVPLVIGHILVWVSVVLTVLSGCQYVYSYRRYLADEN